MNGNTYITRIQEEFFTPLFSGACISIKLHLSLSTVFVSPEPSDLEREKNMAVSVPKDLFIDIDITIWEIETHHDIISIKLYKCVCDKVSRANLWGWEGPHHVKYTT